MKIKTCTVKSKNNVTSLTYRVVNDVQNQGIPLIFSGGLGGTHLIWSALIKALRRRYKIIIWDYPGLTAKHKANKNISVDILSLTNYQLAILKNENIDKAYFIGWSFGSQVILEMTRKNKSLVAAIVTICGVSGQSFSGNNSSNRSKDPIAAALGLRSSLPEAIGWVSRKIDHIEKLKSMLQKIEHPTRWAKRLGFVDPGVNEIIFDAVIRDFIDLDSTIYRRYVQIAAKHDVADLLKDIDVPVLIAAGQRDNLVPISKIRKMANVIANSEFIEVRGGTHFLPIEYPQLLALTIDDFLQRNKIQ